MNCQHPATPPPRGTGIKTWRLGKRRGRKRAAACAGLLRRGASTHLSPTATHSKKKKTPFAVKVPKANSCNPNAIHKLAPGNTTGGGGGSVHSPHHHIGGWAWSLDAPPPSVGYGVPGSGVAQDHRTDNIFCCGLGSGKRKQKQKSARDSHTNNTHLFPSSSRPRK